MIKTLSLVSLFAVVVFATSTSAANSDFPHRTRFNDASVIEINDLHHKLENVIVVDVRSRYEFDTLHIKGATNISLSNRNFAARLRELRKGQNKTLVLYCNGGTCKKSYKAVRKARKGGVSNVVAFDGGIYNWASTYPARSVLLGQNPMRADAFINNKAFKGRMLTAVDFETRMGPRAQVLDIRDRAQRDTQLFPFKEKRAQLDEIDRLKTLVMQARLSGKTLLIYDKVGKQVRWFQYFLERQGVRKYYFMKGGSEGYYEAKLGKFRIKIPKRVSQQTRLTETGGFAPRLFQRLMKMTADFATKYRNSMLPHSFTTN